MKKIIPLITSFIALSLCAFSEEKTAATPQAAAAPEKPACCLKAEAKGKTCQKKCCVEAAKEGKVCEKCLKKQEERKEKKGKKEKNEKLQTQ